MKRKLKPSFNAQLVKFKNESLNAILELQIYEDIGPDWYGDGLTAATVRNAITAAGTFASITVRINSPGGDAFEGVAILNLLRAQKKPVNVYVDGIAASAASIIAMAGDTITMGTGAMMMVHNAWTFCMGDGDDMRKCGETLDAISASIGDAYVKRTGKTAAQIKAIMDAETWMGAQECVDEGFATGLADTEEDAEQMALAKSFKSLAKLKHVPEKLRSKASESKVACTCTCGECEAGDCTDCTVDGCNDTTPCNCDPTVTDSSNLSQYEARLNLLNL